MDIKFYTKGDDEFTISNESLNIKLLSTMTKWAEVNNDVIFVFRKTLESDIKEPYFSMLKNFIIRINSGVDAKNALNNEIEKIKSPFMKNVFINIESVLENNGDLRLLLSKFEYEAYKIEETLHNNNIKIYKDKIVLSTLIIFVILALIRLFAFGYQNVVITIFSVSSIVVGIFTSYAVGKFKY